MKKTLAVLLLATISLLLIKIPATNAQGAPPTNTPRANPASPTDAAATLVPSATEAAKAKATRTPTVEPPMPILGTYETPSEKPLTAIPPAMPSPVPTGDDV